MTVDEVGISVKTRRVCRTIYLQDMPDETELVQKEEVDERLTGIVFPNSTQLSALDNPRCEFDFRLSGIRLILYGIDSIGVSEG